MRVDERDLARELDRVRARPTPPVFVPGPVELLRRPASARMDRAGAREGLGRAARRRGVHGHQPARPGPRRARLRRAVVLQTLRLSDGRRVSPGAEGGALPSCIGRGSPAARSRSPRCRATSTIWPKASRRSKTGRVDYLALPAVEIGLQHIESIGIDTIHERVRCLTGWLLDQLLALTQTNGEAARPHLRSADDRPARRHRDLQFLRRRRPRHRSSHRRTARQRGQHLAADRVLLQSRRAAKSRSASPAPSCRRASGSPSTRRT